MAYLTAAQVRSRVPALANVTTYPSTELERLVLEFTEIAEDYLGVAYEPRTVTAEQVVRPNQLVKLANPQVRTLTAVTINETALTAGELADLTVDKVAGTVIDGLWVGSPFALFTYSHGYDAPTEVLLRACSEYVRSVAFADRSGQSRDVIAQSMDGSFTRYSTPDWNRGRPTGFLEVDRLLNSLTEFRTHGVA
tara:strand:+ start:253 stop:834 length:582 start_codon:yes stop_codon:yes gene_type:complete